jgi:hypothetical protein
METYFYFVITPDARVYRVEIKSGRIPELDELQNAVGGYIETVSGPLYPVIGIVNEEGRLKGLPDNPYGSMVVQYPELLCGNVVIAKVDGEEIVGFDAPEAIRIGQRIHQTCILFSDFFGGED